MGRIVEGVWDCVFCGTKDIRSGIKSCPNCSAPQGENTRFRLPMEIKKNYVKESNVSRKEDWRCGYCGALNSDSTDICRCCGGSRAKSKEDYFAMRKRVEDGKDR